MRRPSLRLALGLGALVCALGTGVVAARAGERDPPAVIEAGRRLLAENGCNGACHRAYAADDDPLTLYTRSTRRVHSRDELHRQVETCVSRLGSMIFPEDVGSIAAALDHDFYRFE